MTHFATADDRGDDLFAAQLEAFREFVDGGRPRRPDRPRRQQRRRAARAGQPLRHGALRHRHLRDGSVRRGPGRPRARAGAVAALLGRGGAPLRGGRLGRLRAPLDGLGADLGRHRPDRLRRRLAARADQQLRRADRRAAPPAGRHGQHGQRDGGARPGHRRGGGRRGGADRRAGRRAHTGRGGGAPARTRSTTRSPAALTPRVRRRHVP